jgi:CP family cyanate transporter-like MFS transporter
MVDSGTHQAQDTFTPDIRDKEPYQKRYRWLMLALLWLAYFTFGIVSFTLPPLTTPIIEELDITYSQMGTIMGAWPLTYILVATIGGAIIDRWGIRKSMFAGILIIALSESLRYFASGFATMFLFVAMFGLGGPMISIGAPKTISLWFRGKERGTAVGVYLTGAWIGGAIALSMTNSVIMPLIGYSWRNAFACFGLIALAIAILWGIFARDVRPSEAGESTSINKVFRGLISVRNVQLILIAGFVSFAVGHGYTDWLPKMLEASGLSPVSAGFAATIPILSGIPTVLTIPRILPPHYRGRAIALLSLVVTAAIWTTSVTSNTPMIIGLVIYGMANNCAMPLLVLMLMELPEVGSKYTGSASGMFFCIAEAGGFAGPFIVGAAKDLSGSFLAGTCLLAGLSFVRMFIALSIKINSIHHAKAPT